MYSGTWTEIPQDRTRDRTVWVENWNPSFFKRKKVTSTCSQFWISNIYDSDEKIVSVWLKSSLNAAL